MPAGAPDDAPLPELHPPVATAALPAPPPAGPAGHGRATATAARPPPLPVLPSLPLASDRAEAPCATEPCSQCCHDIEMLLSEADVQRIAASLGADAPKDWHGVADDGYLQLRTRDGPPARGSPGGRPCVFLGEDGRCTVWAVRPEGCRLYPAMWDEGLRRAVLDADYCPHTEGFALPGTMDAAVRRLVQRLEAERVRRLARP